ncbi:YopX family protein [Mucilaginibacter sp.]|uniref:YopX family protein n=1 Tax=Mucilaginibacter sp. TaxID=1882438 RepID=UPI00261AA2F1|nr:YopX family protein [Mucilaginibacter sp.]MDB5032234.1 hypothetical protein [Mucilaginibacter sp.]
MAREIKFKFLFGNDNGDTVITREFTIEEIINKSMDDIWESLAECNCQPICETYVVECGHGDLYADYSFKKVIEFTGQADPDGKDIYDGDTLQHGENIYIVQKRDGNCNWLGVNEDGQTGMLLSFCSKDKVIGNVHKPQF